MTAATELTAAVRLRRTLDDLGSDLSEPVRLVYFDALSQREVAERLGLSPAQVKARIAVALRRIGDSLLARGADE